MKILRFLGFFMVLVLPTVAHATDACPTGQYRNLESCTPCPTGYTSYSLDNHNSYLGQCYKECTTECITYDWNNYIPSYATGQFTFEPFFEKENQEHQILFYGVATGTPAQTCNTLNSKYCNYNARCSTNGTNACKPGHTPVEFHNPDGTLITTYYVVNTTAWSSQNTTNGTHQYSPTIYPVFRAPTPSNGIINFKGYYDAQIGGNKVIDNDLTLTFEQANGISGSTPKVLYAQYECASDIYLNANGGTLPAACTNAMPFQPGVYGTTPSLPNPDCIPTKDNCEFLGYYLKGVQYYDSLLKIMHQDWENCNSATVTLNAEWDCSEIYTVQCPDSLDPDSMRSIDGGGIGAGQTFSIDENNMLKACYHTCAANQTLTGWDVYLNDSINPAATFTNYPIRFVAGETYGDANPITLMAHCEATQVKVTYVCGTHGTGTGASNYATIGQQYNVLSAASANCTAQSGYEFLNWNASTGGTFQGGTPVNPWTIDEDVTLTADWIGACNLITFDDNNAAGTNVNSGDPQRKRTGETDWYMAAPGDVKMCGKAYTSDPQVSVPTNGNAIFRGYFAPNDSTHAIFGTNGYPTSYGNGWTTSSAVTLKALWDCPNEYTWNPSTRQCEINTTSATYLCYKNDEGKVDNEVTLVNYAVRPLSWYNQCNINQNNFNGWLFSGDNLMHTAGSTISPWTYGSTETFVPAYNARFDCDTTHWQAPSGGNHSARLVILGDGLSMPAMNCEPRSAYAGWLPDTPNWTSTYTAGLTSPIPGASCNGDISVVGGGNFNWSCPTDLTFAPDDDLITQTINLSCGSTSGQITVSYGDDISAMVTQWFNTNCHGGPCQYPTNPTTYAHGYWKICADWNGVTPPGLTPVVGESGCYQTDPAHPNYDFTLLDSYWNQIDNFSVTSVWRCPKWVKYKCTANSEALYQDNMNYAAYYEEPYTILDHETVGCDDSGYEFTGWYKEGQPTVEYAENETIQSWPYDDVVILVGKNGDANDYNIVYHSLGGNDMNASMLCQHMFTYSANAQDFNPDISGCIPTREFSTFLGWCASSDTAGCTPIEQIPAGQNANLDLYAIWECILPYHSNQTGTACVSCEINQFWNGTSCESCPSAFPRSKPPFNWSEKSCYRECPTNTILGAAGQTCDTNADLYGLTCTENVDFTDFIGSTGKQIEFKGNYDANLNTCNDQANSYCPRGLFGCGNMAYPFKPMTAPVNFYDATGQQNFGSRFIFGSRGGGNTIDLGTGNLWSFLAGPGQKSDVLHNNVGGVMVDYQYTHIIYPTYAAPEPANIPGSAFDGYYYPRTGGTQYVDDNLALDNTNAQTVLSGPSGDSNTARSLYANYSGIEYSVTYDCGTGGGNPPAMDTGIHYGDSFTPAANTCANPGHEFGGWVVSNSGEIKQPGTPFTWQYTENKVFTADWGGSVVYHINYELYGGTASNTGMPTTYTYESGATINGVPTRDNSIFDGWCIDNTLQNCAMTQTLVHETGDKTFYAKWRCESGYALNNNLCNSNVITIIYANGGHGVAPMEPSSCTYGHVFTLPAAIVPNPADGYTFNKWTVNGGYFGASTQIACDYTNLGVYQGTVTITATWGTNPIIIDWNENGGNALPNGSCIYDDDLTLTNAPTYTGYTFNGWLLADGTTYADPSSTMHNGCVSTYLGVASGTSTAITAQWCQNCVQPNHGTCTLVPKMNGVCEYTATCDAGYDLSGNGTPNPVCTNHKYTITYRPNGGTPATDQVQTVNYSEQFTSLGATTFNKPNNILMGWTPVSGGTFITGLATQYSYNVASDTILDAAWGTCTCTKGTGVATCTTSVTNNTCQAVATCDEGYINPNVMCIGTACDAACSACPSGFVPVNNECLPCSAGTYQFGTQCLPCPENYISPLEGATECTPCENGYSSNADHTACEPNTITLVYANGGHGTAPAQSTCLYNRTFALPGAIVPNPTDGHTFSKWGVNNNEFDANASVVCNYANLGVYNGTAIVVATWVPDTYIVSFDANGGTGGQTAPVNATYNQAMPNISTVPPQKTGYTFMGWYDDANYQSGVLYYTASGISARTYDKTTNTTLYAGWYANTITLNFANGGHGVAPNARTCMYGETVSLPTAIMAEGFTFQNWAVANRTFNASAPIICNEANLGVSSGSVTVTAQWQPKTYTVTYNCGTGNSNNAPTQDEAIYDANFTPATNTCQYTGHIFTGWLVSGTADVRESGVAFKWHYTDNKIFTAQWDTEAYNIIYELNGGSNYTGAPQTYTFGVGARIDGTPTRVNSAFKGWCTDAQLQNCAPIQSIARSATGTKTFYVKWVCENGFIANADNTACDSCPTEQHAENGECVDNVIECELPDTNYAIRTWNQTRNAYGPCTVVTCAPDYHLISNTCVKDTRECTVANGYGTQDWNGTQWGKCVAEVCEPGFEIVGDSCTECGNRRQNGEIVVSSYANGCEIASCMYHGQKYILNNNECELICETRSDETGSMAWNESRQKCARTCNQGYKMW